MVTTRFWRTSDLDQNFGRDLPTLGELLSNMRETSKSELAGFGGEHRERLTLNYRIKEDSGRVITPRIRRSEDRGR